jgi:hypothetical protein
VETKEDRCKRHKRESAKRTREKKKRANATIPAADPS